MWSSTAGAFGSRVRRLAADPSFPSKCPSPHGAEAGADAEKSARGPAIWLVEDSAIDAFVIREALADFGARLDIRTLSHGDAALGAIEGIAASSGAGVPDLVLLDLNVPRVSGVEVLSALRNSEHCARVPVIVVTSSDSAADIESTRKLGVTAYFRKPHDLDQFLSLADLVKQVLERR